MRNLEKSAAEGRAILEKHKRAQLNVTEINEFYKMFNDDNSGNGGLFGVIAAAFEVGVSVGAKCASK